MINLESQWKENIPAYRSMSMILWLVNLHKGLWTWWGYVWGGGVGWPATTDLPSPFWLGWSFSQRGLSQSVVSFRVFFVMLWHSWGIVVPRCAENSDVAWFTFKADGWLAGCAKTHKKLTITYSNWNVDGTVPTYWFLRTLYKPSFWYLCHLFWP